MFNRPEQRLHFSLDMANREMSLRAFSARKATDAIREDNPKWMEVDTDE